jgi:hypothetical protein
VPAKRNAWNSVAGQTGVIQRLRQGEKRKNEQIRGYKKGNCRIANYYQAQCSLHERGVSRPKNGQKAPLVLPFQLDALTSARTELG